MTAPAAGTSGGDEFHPQRCAASRTGMVATQHWAATEAGCRMLQRGGNAVDAAVAAAFALGVCEPQASGLGGQTMVLLRSAAAGRTVALDGSSRAPGRATPVGLRAGERVRGHPAATVPSTVAVLARLLESSGTLPLAAVLAPAVELCEAGVPWSALQRRLLLRELEHVRQGSAAALLLRDGRDVPAVGDVLRQPALGRTLRRLGEHGWQDFYRGGIAVQLAADMAAHGGLVAADDLARIPEPVERPPLTCGFAGKEVHTLPPPGAGPVLARMLAMLARFPQEQCCADTPEGALVLCEVIRRANLDRWGAGAAVEPAVREIRALVRGGGETTHLSAMDAAGNAVALTQSIEQVWGSCAASPELGFLYNSYVNSFVYDDPAHPHYLRPDAPPWADVAPTLLLDGGRPWLALGSPGSERIASAVVQVLLRALRQPLLDAVTAPRLHCSADGVVTMEGSRLRSDIAPFLAGRGYTVRSIEPFSFYLGCVQAVLRDGATFVGVADLRRDGAAAGP